MRRRVDQTQHRSLALVAAVMMTAILSGSNLSTASAQPADAPSPDGASAGAGLPENELQMRLTDFKMWIVANPKFKDGGYIQTINDVARGSAELLWHGESPLQQEATAEAAARGIELRITSRPFSCNKAKLRLAPFWTKHS
jgi:hypothetical protein